MSKQSNRLTVKRIEKLKDAGRYHDGRGLYLQITPAGARSWILRYARDGREHMLGLGPLHTVSLKAAREKATKARDRLLDGVNPVTERRGDRVRLRLDAAQATTFRQAAEHFLVAKEGEWTNAVHRAQMRTTLTTYAFPVFGDLPVAAIDTDLVLRVLEPIWSTKRQTAQRLRGRIERVLDYAKARKWRDGENPVRWRGHLANLLAKPDKTVRHHAALPFEEMPTFMAELRKREGIPARALEFCILTATRTGEVVAARWDEIDLAAKVWVIPAARMKAKRAHRIPLSDRAVEILSGLPREANNPYVFVGDRVGRSINPRALFNELRTMRPRLTVHGFRSSFRDWCGDCTDFARDVAEAALAHKVGDDTERAYRRGDAFEKRRRLMDSWAAFCAGETGATIIPLRAV